MQNVNASCLVLFWKNQSELHRDTRLSLILTLVVILGAAAVQRIRDLTNYDVIDIY